MRQNMYVALFAALLTMVGCAPRTQYFRPQDPSSVYDINKGVYHEISKGQTLWRIAKEYGADVNLLANANHIRDYNSLRVGQLVFIPYATEKKEITRIYKAISYPKVHSQDVFYLPVRGGKVNILFGEDKGRIRNKGIDIMAARGSSVFASKTGVVTFSDPQMRGMGHILVVDHQDGYSTIYAHLSRTLVREGEVVKQGQKIAVIGTSGDISVPTLHFEIRKNGKAVDPLRLLPKY